MRASVSKALCLLLAAVTLLAAAPAGAGLRFEDRLLVDAECGLTWVADGRYVVHAGLAERAVLSRPEALAVIARLNAGWADNFGHTDWRLPTERELRHLLSEKGGHLAELTGDDPRLVGEALATDRAGVAVRDAVVVWPVRGSLVEAGFSDVAVFATNSVRLKNQAEVQSGEVVVNDASSGPTLVDGYEIGMDPKAEIAGSVRADSVRIKNNAEVFGDVAYNDLFLQGEVHGALITPLALPVFSLLPAFHAQPPAPGSPDVEVPRDGFALLPAGDYGDVTIGRDGTLVLSGGIYNVGSIDTDRDARLLFGAPSQVRVEGRMAIGRDSVIGPDAGSGVPIEELVLYVAGINGTGGGIEESPLAVDFDHDCKVESSIYAPNGTIKIGHGSEVTGAFLGRDVLVDNKAEVNLASFFFNRPPVAGDDSATADEGGTTSVLDSGATSVLDNDTDPDLDVLTVTTTPVVAPVNGTLVLNADGTFSYTHDGSETTSDSFVYEVCDQGFPVLCDTATVSITVVPVNDPPEAADDSATVPFGGTTTVLDSGATSMLDNDFDAEGGVLTVTTTPVVAPAHGTLVLNADGTFSYTHDGSEFLTDSFVYEVCDDGSPVECDTATVSITVLAPATLTVVRFGLGDGEVTSSPAGIDCGVVCSAEFPAATEVTLTAVAFAGSTFGGFTGDPDCADGVVTMNASKTCFARFDVDAPPATLTVTLAGTGSGTVTSDPAGIDCPDTACSASYPIPTRVTLTATADPGSSFAGWSGAADCSDGIVDLLADVSCTALFEPGQAEITVVKTGLGSGTVTSSPAGIDCGPTCSAEFDASTPVTLTAVADAGSTFGGFAGDPDCADGVITPNADKTCFARFDLDVAPAVLTVTLAGGGGGTVSSDVPGIDCPGTCSAGYPIPTRVTLTATADSGSAFTGWSGDADCADGVVDMLADVSCTATFEIQAPPATFELTVLFLGGGTGLVASNPPALICSGDCSADFTAGTTVTLQARPDGVFGGWGGDCSGAAFSTTVLLDADKVCTVTFE